MILASANRLPVGWRFLRAALRAPFPSTFRKPAGIGALASSEESLIQRAGTSHSSARTSVRIGPVPHDHSLRASAATETPCVHGFQLSSAIWTTADLMSGEMSRDRDWERSRTTSHNTSKSASALIPEDAANSPIAPWPTDSAASCSRLNKAGSASPASRPMRASMMRAKLVSGFRIASPSSRHAADRSSAPGRSSALREPKELTLETTASTKSRTPSSKFRAGMWTSTPLRNRNECVEPSLIGRARIRTVSPPLMNSTSGQR